MQGQGECLSLGAALLSLAFAGEGGKEDLVKPTGSASPIQSVVRAFRSGAGSRSIGQRLYGRY